MHSIAVFIFVLLFVVTFGHGVNYCGAKMCGYTNAHTLCQFVDRSPLCVGYLEGGLSSAEKSHVLARLNRRRNDVASGKIPGLPSAGNMLKLRWVEELAREAQMWADQCRPARVPEEHDACRDLYSINVGQCIASVVGESPGMKIESMVDIWFMQNKYFKGNVTYYEPPEYNKRYYGDFAQLIWARTFMVGCGRARFLIPMNGRPRTIERLVCNFAPQGPTPYRPLWTPSVPATACSSRSRPCRFLTSLCDYLTLKVVFINANTAKNRKTILDYIEHAPRPWHDTFKTNLLIAENELNQPSDIDESMTIEDHILLNAVLEIERNETIFQGSLDEIYLTYLAMITMQSPEIVTISHFNSMQKRDLVEKINIDDGSILKEALPNFDLGKSQIIRNANTKVSQKRLQTIGRPKAYKIEELSHTENNHKVENQDMTEAVMRRKKDFYYDYHMDSFEDNVTFATNGITNIMDTHENYTFDDHTKEMLSTNNALPAVTLSDKMPNTAEKEGGFDTHWINISTQEDAFKRPHSDDYLSAETARELQAALDRMEHEASNSSSTRKTRRQVEDYPDSGNSNENDVTDDVTVPAEGLNYTLLSDADVSKDSPPDNTSVETPPILNMMLKYMPYLKNYENDILRNNVQNSDRCGSLFVLLVIHALFT